MFLRDFLGISISDYNIYVYISFNFFSHLHENNIVKFQVMYIAPY